MVLYAASHSDKSSLISGVKADIPDRRRAAGLLIPHINLLKERRNNKIHVMPHVIDNKRPGQAHGV